MTLTLAIAVIGTLIAVVVAMSSKDKPATSLRAAAEADPLPPMAKHLHVKVVDAGAMRFVDLRTWPNDALITRAALGSVERTLAPLPSVACTVFVTAASVAALATELGETSHVIFWGRFKEIAPNSTMVSLYVDGPVPNEKAIAWAKEVGVTVLVAWPEIIGTDPATGQPRTWSGREILAA